MPRSPAEFLLDLGFGKHSLVVSLTSLAAQPLHSGGQAHWSGRGYKQTEFQAAQIPSLALFGFQLIVVGPKIISHRSNHTF